MKRSVSFTIPATCLSLLRWLTVLILNRELMLMWLLIGGIGVWKVKVLMLCLLLAFLSMIAGFGLLLVRWFGSARRVVLFVWLLLLLVMSTGFRLIVTGF